MTATCHAEHAERTSPVSAVSQRRPRRLQNPAEDRRCGTGFAFVIDMDEKRQKSAGAEPPSGRESTDPGPDTVDPAPWLGQVGEGATLPAGEAIAHVTSQIIAPDDVDDTVQISGDPEMPPLAPHRDDRE
jgi:hypothetical protein